MAGKAPKEEAWQFSESMRGFPDDYKEWRLQPVDFYSRLKVERKATIEDIRKNYYYLARAHHPDKATDASSAEEFKEINTAWNVLSDN